MPDLTSKQRAHLRRLAHASKPLVHIGKDGVTVPTLRTLRDALSKRELLKVKVLDNAPASARDIASQITEGIENVAVVQIVGRSLTLYRPDPEAPTIRLPK